MKRKNKYTLKDYIEYIKCKKSIAYFYNKYFRPKGFPYVTDKDFENLMKGKSRRRGPSSYPWFNYQYKNTKFTKTK